MTGADADRFLEPVARAGYRHSQPLIGGFSTYNTKPWAGALAGPVQALTRPFAGFVFEPGQGLFVIATPYQPGTRKGVWVGLTCLMTEHGLEPLSRFPVDRVHVIDPAAPELQAI
jgi:hypothetical protein